MSTVRVVANKIERVCWFVVQLCTIPLFLIGALTVLSAARTMEAVGCPAWSTDGLTVVVLLAILALVVVVARSIGSALNEVMGRVRKLCETLSKV